MPNKHEAHGHVNRRLFQTLNSHFHCNSLGTQRNIVGDLAAQPVGLYFHIGVHDLLDKAPEQVANAVMDAEADQLCGGRANSRNGYRERPLATCFGTLTLRIPKLRSGSFFPDDVIERYRKFITRVDYDPNISLGNTLGKSLTPIAKSTFALASLLSSSLNLSASSSMFRRNIL